MRPSGTSQIEVKKDEGPFSKVIKSNKIMCVYIIHRLHKTAEDYFHLG